MQDPGILCIQHCGARIFSFALPETCPLCNNKILNERSSVGLMPFRLPFPFVRASQAQCCVILRPTNGDFLHDYNNSSNLHIGVTTSQGVIIEFDTGGLKRSTPKDENNLWQQSLTVSNVPEAWWEYWDETLAKFCKDPQWTAARYNKDTHNCYSFVLKFLETLGYGEVSRAACNRTLFCEKFICPRTVVAGKYISLYRKLRENGHFIHLSSNKIAQGWTAGTRATSSGNSMLPKQ